METQYLVFKTPREVAEYFAETLYKKILKASAESKCLTVALSGGYTPKILFAVLAEKYRSLIRWEYVHLFWVDERCVPPGDKESNFGMTKQMLLDMIIIPGENVHRIRGEDDPGEEAERYSKEISRLTEVENNIPVFDVIILGMGDDGHTASIFPGNEKLLYSEKICETAVHPVSGQRRITLTGKVINNAREVYFLVTGMKKSQITGRIINRDRNFSEFPASHINPEKGPAIWLIDEEAAFNIK